MSGLSFEDILKKQGYSLTKPRIAVFDALSDAESMSMSQLIAACKPSIDRATVYRTVDLFEKLGIVRRVQLGWKYRIELSDLFRAHHHHIECINCGRVVELEEDTLLENAIKNAARKSGFEPEEHHLEVKGLCPMCQKALAKHKP